MRTDEFDFYLPEELIAQFPPKERGTSRLMILNRNTGEMSHSTMKDISNWIQQDTLIVLNDTRVRKARLYGRKIGGTSEVEFLLIDKISKSKWEAVAKRAKRQRVGDRFLFPNGVEGVITGEIDSRKIINFDPPIDDTYLESFGHVPLPPYIKRGDFPEDEKRYQTVFAKEYGAVAAPTAGLHFTWDILNDLKAKRNIEIAYVTLHVGIGTFSPIRTDEIEKHKMHSEEFIITEENAIKIEEAFKEGRDILAVGTTVVRTLESAWQEEKEKLVRGHFSTELFIYPGYRFKIVKKLLTNFHTPRSSLLLLVSAFAEREKLLNAYETAVKMRYRFFSYGDAMLIL